jgi:hypothetical protein
MFENFKARKIVLRMQKRVLNKNLTTYSDEEVKRIVDYLYTLAELEVECGENQNERTRLILHRNDSSISSIGKKEVDSVLNCCCTRLQPLL